MLTRRRLLTDQEDRMRFTFTIKTKSGALVTDVHVDARDRKEAEEKLKRENPTCTVVKVEQG
jgi:hypothetical protein